MNATPITKRLGSALLASPNTTVEAELVRFADGSRNNSGQWVEGQDSTTPLRVVTAPLSGEDRKLLDEGVREAVGRKFWLTLPATAVQAGTQDGDLIRFDGDDFKVVHLNDWGGFREAICVVPQACACPPEE